LRVNLWDMAPVILNERRGVRPEHPAVCVPTKKLSSPPDLAVGGPRKKLVRSEKLMRHPSIIRDVGIGLDVRELAAELSGCAVAGQIREALLNTPNTGWGIWLGDDCAMYRTTKGLDNDGQAVRAQQNPYYTGFLMAASSLPVRKVIRL